MSAKRAREAVTSTDDGSEIISPVRPEKRPRSQIRPMAIKGQEDDDSSLGDELQSDNDSHGSLSTYLDDDLDEEMTFSSDDDEDVLITWFKTGYEDKSIDPKTTLKQVGAITDQNQLDFLSEEVAWNTLYRVVREISRQRRATPVAPPRTRLPHLHSLVDAVNLIRTSRRIIVLTGAGISVSCGIPDFRSADGLYKMIESRFDLPDPQALFDIRFFVDDPEPFFQFAKMIYPGNYVPSLSHRFIRMLQDKGKLLRNYTQNIDTLEQVAGITECLECHGSFRTASCFSCKAQVPCEAIRDKIMREEIPRCNKCSGKFNVLKPDIVFFGEGLPPKFSSQFCQDVNVSDLLIVMGSSLRVRPVCTIPHNFPPNIPQILINRERVGHPHQFDIELLGNCDAIVTFLLSQLGWPAATNSHHPKHSVAVPEFLSPYTYLFEGAVRPQASITQPQTNTTNISQGTTNINAHNSTTTATIAATAVPAATRTRMRRNTQRQTQNSSSSKKSKLAPVDYNSRESDCNSDDGENNVTNNKSDGDYDSDPDISENVRTRSRTTPTTASSKASKPHENATNATRRQQQQSKQQEQPQSQKGKLTQVDAGMGAADMIVLDTGGNGLPTSSGILTVGDEPHTNGDVDVDADVDGDAAGDADVDVDGDGADDADDDGDDELADGGALDERALDGEA
eukprot:c5676_g1_i1.p1 GENE.c5676_g1_i1~~c5676_g1_i1.p1  ORF type:complete len:680 (-),score=143.48 c5676_g1_i1:365-2404(-)